MHELSELEVNQLELNDANYYGHDWISDAVDPTLAVRVEPCDLELVELIAVWAHYLKGIRWKIYKALSTAGVGVTNACNSTVNAPPECVNARSIHFRTQLSTPYTETERDVIYHRN